MKNIFPYHLAVGRAFLFFFIFFFHYQKLVSHFCVANYGRKDEGSFYLGLFIWGPLSVVFFIPFWYGWMLLGLFEKPLSLIYCISLQRRPPQKNDCLEK